MLARLRRRPRWSGSAAIPAVAPVLAARLLRHGPAVVLHEQNAVLGRANRLLAGCADVLALSFAEPCGSGRQPRPRHRQSGAPGDRGRRGHAVLRSPRRTRSGCWCSAARSARACSATWCRRRWRLCRRVCGQRLRVTQQCRRGGSGRVRAAYAACGMTASFAVLRRRGGTARAAHLVIARAGASTVAELAVAGRPAILVPLPRAIDDHQTRQRPRRWPRPAAPG